jgi:DNA polymerase II small subunit
MGHVHKNGYEKYRGIVLINSGTWQARTEFQVKQGHIPSPCILPVYDMHKGEISVVNFEEKPEGPLTSGGFL